MKKNSMKLKKRYAEGQVEFVEGEIVTHHLMYTQNKHLYSKSQQHSKWCNKSKGPIITLPHNQQCAHTHDEHSHSKNL